MQLWDAGPRYYTAAFFVTLLIGVAFIVLQVTGLVDAGLLEGVVIVAISGFAILFIRKRGDHAAKQINRINAVDRSIVVLLAAIAGGYFLFKVLWQAIVS